MNNALIQKKKTAAAYRTLHSHAPARTPEAKLSKLEAFRRLHRQGLRGRLLERRTHMTVETAKKWAAELGFDLGLGGAQ